MKKFFIIILLIFVSITVFSQQIKNIGEIPFIQKYSPEDYKAALQNWDGLQDNRGILYFANTGGSVLEFDGKQWNSIKISENAITSLCLEPSTNRIYVGGKNIIGYLKPSYPGKFEFVSLFDKIPEKYRDFKNIWDIFITKDSSIFFQTFDEIFILKNDSVTVLPVDSYFPNGLFLISFKVKDEIFVYTKYKGLYQLVGKDLKFIEGSEVIAKSMVRAIFPYKKNNSYIIFTWYDGAFVYENGKFSKIQTPIDGFLYQDLYRAIRIHNKYYLFQRFSGGLIITDNNFNIVQIISKQSQLDQKVYKAFLDKQDNLWLCTDDGISCIYLFSPFSILDQSYGLDKRIISLDALKYKDKLIISTNYGVFAKKWSDCEDKVNIATFEQIKNPRGNKNIPTNHIDTIDNTVFASASNGFYQIKSHNDSAKFKVKYLLTDRGIHDFIIPSDNKNVILGIAGVMFLFKKQAKEWKYIKDFKQIHGEYIVKDKNNNIWISDLISGVTKIKFDTSYENIKKIEHFAKNDSLLDGLPESKNIRIFKIKDDIVFTTSQGIYQFDNENQKFYSDTTLNQYFKPQTKILFLYEDSFGNIWYKTEQSIDNNKNLFLLGELKKIDNKYKVVENVFYPFKNQIFSFNQISPNEYIIGSAGKLIHYDARFRFNPDKKYPALIRKVKLLDRDSVIFDGIFYDKNNNILLSQQEEDIKEIPYKYKNIRFEFSAAYFQSPEDITFSYYLEGNDQTWSPWTKEVYKDYSNLKPNKYTFLVKAKNIYGVESTIAKYSFIIKPPFYLTITAFVIYFILAALFLWLVVYLYTRRLRKQKEYLEEVVKQRTKEIEQQKQEIEAQKDQVEKKNLEIEKINIDLTDSIEYAKRIQTAILPLEKTIKTYLPESFILFRPRDIVSGDFYWFIRLQNKIFFAAVDCTGHGVPGAFMSLIGAETLSMIVLNEQIYEADKILERLNQHIINALKQDKTENQDGMDMALCVIDKEKKEIQFSGAKNPLYYIANNELTKIRGSRQAIGGLQFADFQNHVVKYQSPSWFYIFSDGYADQFGGEDSGKAQKFMVSRFKKLLLDIHKLPMAEQCKILDDKLNEWKGNIKQTDDIMVIGFKL